MPLHRLLPAILLAFGAGAAAHAGELVQDDEVFPDGSRKAFGR